jgi:hypothetical protein
MAQSQVDRQVGCDLAVESKATLAQSGQKQQHQGQVKPLNIVAYQ